MAAGKLKKFHLGSMLGPVNGTMYFSAFPFPAVAGGGVSQKERPTHNMSVVTQSRWKSLQRHKLAHHERHCFIKTQFQAHCAVHVNIPAVLCWLKEHRKTDE